MPTFVAAMGREIRWDIRRDGRAWVGGEFGERHARTPEKLEVVGGRLLWADDELLTMLGMLLEQAGADRAVALGSLSVWQEAVQARERVERPLRPLWKEVLFGPLEPAMIVFGLANAALWLLLIVLFGVPPRPHIPECVRAVFIVGGLGLSIYAVFKLMSLGGR